MGDKWMVVEVGERTYVVEMNDHQLMYAPCEIVNFCGDAVQYQPEDVQVIPLQPDVHLYFTPLDNHVNDIKALLLGQLTR